MIKWSNAYLEQIEKCGGINKYTDIKLKQKRKLLNIIRKFSGDGKIIEAGCGTGIVSSKLASEGYCVTAIDIDNEVLDLAKRVEIENYGKIITNYKIDSIFDLDYGKDEFDLCFSVGVLEHFNDEKIVESIKKQIFISKKTIIVIPTRWFDCADTLHGDDRFLKLSYWRELISKSDGKIVLESSYPFRGKGFSYITKLKRIFRPKAYRIFVIEKEN